MEESYEKAIKEHLAFCEDCRQELEEIRVVNAMLDEIKIPSLPNDFTKIIMNKIKEKNKCSHTSIWKEFGKWGVSFIATGLIMLVLNYTSIGMTIATLTANIEKNPINLSKIYEYSPSNIVNMGLDQIENMIENIESRR